MLWVLPAMVFLLLFCTPSVLSEKLSDNEIKAALVLKLPQFVTLPDDLFEDTRSELIIGVVGDKDFMASVKKLHKGKRINGRRVKLIVTQDADDLKQCHVVYVDTSTADLSENEIDRLIELGAMIISNNIDVASRGGMVYLRLKNNKYVIEINLDVAERNKIVFNSQLLRIATIVRDKK